MVEIEGSLNKDYNEIKEDPTALIQYINKYVRVQLIKNACSYLGFTHSIDPVTGSIILLVPNKDTYKTVVIPGHAVLYISEVTPTADIKIPTIHNSAPSLSNLDLKLKKQLIMAWFKNNLLPVTESGENIVIGNVNVIPPYNATDICTNNPAVALQIRNIMENMPDNNHI